jgi:hypothetical protein
VPLKLLRQTSSAIAAADPWICFPDRCAETEMSSAGLAHIDVKVASLIASDRRAQAKLDVAFKTSRLCLARTNCNVTNAIFVAIDERSGEFREGGMRRYERRFCR